MSCSEEPRKPLGAGETTSTQLLLLLETRITFVAISLWHGRSSRPSASGLDHFRSHVDALGRYDVDDVDDAAAAAAAADTRSPQKRINSHSRTFFLPLSKKNETSFFFSLGRVLTGRCSKFTSWPFMSFLRLLYISGKNFRVVVLPNGSCFLPTGSPLQFDFIFVEEKKFENRFFSL